MIKDLKWSVTLPLSTVENELLSVNKHCQTPGYGSFYFGERILISGTNLLNGSAVTEVNVLSWWGIQASKNSRQQEQLSLLWDVHEEITLLLMDVKYCAIWTYFIPHKVRKDFSLWFQVILWCLKQTYFKVPLYFWFLTLQ